MDSNKIAFIVLMILIGSGIVSIAVSTFLELRKRKNYSYEEPLQPDVVVKKATVISKYVDTERTGSYRNPSHNLVYHVAFKTENNEIREYSVGEDIYNWCEPQLTADLVTVNGNFFDFGEGEDI